MTCGWVLGGNISSQTNLPTPISIYIYAKTTSPKTAYHSVHVRVWGKGEDDLAVDVLMLAKSTLRQAVTVGDVIAVPKDRVKRMATPLKTHLVILVPREWEAG